MSIEEAAELIVQAGALSEGGDVFLLDMGEPILISELAENMVRLAGLSVRSDDNPEGDIEIVAVGKRPGEKLFEELFYNATSAVPTRHPKILRGLGQLAKPVGITDRIAQLYVSIIEQDEKSARAVLFALIADSDTGKLGASTPQDHLNESLGA